MKYIVLIFLFVLAGCSKPEFSKLETDFNVDGRLIKPIPPVIKEDPYTKFSEVFDQKSIERKVDLLIVVDNSTSMIPDQEKLSREFGNFISQISTADYRIGVITTDTDSEGKENTPGFWGNLDLIPQTGKRFISKEDVNPEALFKDLINRKETVACDLAGRPTGCVSFDERPMLAVKMSIDKRFTTNKGFFRDDADLGIMIISDEDETSFEDGSYFTAYQLLDHFVKAFNNQKTLVSFSIAIPEGDKKCFKKQADETNTQAASYGTRIGLLSRITGGFFVNICEENFSQHISEVSRYVERKLLPFKVKIPNSTLMSSVDISVKTAEGEDFKVIYEVDGNYLRIIPTPPEDSMVSVSFKYEKTESFAE